MQLILTNVCWFLQKQLDCLLQVAFQPAPRASDGAPVTRCGWLWPPLPLGLVGACAAAEAEHCMGWEMPSWSRSPLEISPDSYGCQQSCSDWFILLSGIILPSLPRQRRMRGDQKEDICFFLFVWFPQKLAKSPHRFTPSIKVWPFQSISLDVGQQQWLWGRSTWLVVTLSKLNILISHSKTSRFVLILFLKGQFFLNRCLTSFPVFL